jgi:regulator of sigma D
VNNELCFPHTQPKAINPDGWSDYEGTAMLTKFETAREQWGGSSEVIDHWLSQRQSLIVEYVKLAALQPCATKSTMTELPATTEIDGFCRALVDYISAGHFKIYDMVMAKWQSTGFKATDEINQTYANILQTTDPLLNFAEKYLDLAEDDSLHGFDDDMSWVGETLEIRFEVEDQLIQLILDSLSVPPGA